MKAKAWIALLFCLVVVGWCCGAQARAKPYTAAQLAQMKKGIVAALRSKQPAPSWGLWIRDQTTGQMIFRQRSNQWFTPASVLKLLTAAVAAEKLPRQFQFQTRLGLHGRQDGSTWIGDVYLEMVGDPTLQARDLVKLLRALTDRGIETITGHFYVDVNHFVTVPYGPGWMWDELSYGYAAPMGSIVVNKNSFLLHFKPVPGHIRPKIIPDLPSKVATFNNKVRVTAHKNRHCPLTIYSDQNNRYTLSGCLVRNWGKQRRHLAIRDPWPFLRSLLRADLRALHIKLKRNITEHRRRVSIQWVAAHNSPVLALLLQKMLKDSDNLIADALLLELGKRAFNRPGTWESGVRAIQNELQQHLGIDSRQIQLVDGSGLSRYNLITPAQLAKVLLWIDKTPALRALLIPALPVSGQDGTLAWRMRDNVIKGRVVAKTGSMAGVSCLAGFLKRHDGHRLVFAVMMNGLVDKTRVWHRVEDQLLRYLVQGRRKK